MKQLYIMICTSLCLSVMAGEIRTGDSRESVLKAKGEPMGRAALGDGEILIYKDGRVTLKDGRVAETTIKSSEGADIKNMSALGRNKEFCAKKYGSTDTNSAVVAKKAAAPLISLPGAETEVYPINEQWEVRVGFLNGTAQRMEYAKEASAPVLADEFTAIRNAQAEEMSWTKKVLSNPQQDAAEPMGIWVRTDGVTARVKGAVVRFETKQVLDAEAEAAKRSAQEKELERKKKIPMF